jgi:hypothetical protein
MRSTTSTAGSSSGGVVATSSSSVTGSRVIDSISCRYIRSSSYIASITRIGPGSRAHGTGITHGNVRAT